MARKSENHKVEIELHIASIGPADCWGCHQKVWKPDPILVLTEKKLYDLLKPVFNPF